MSSSDYPISLKPFPKPRVSASLGIPDIPSAGVLQSGSFGETSIDTGVESIPNIAQTGFIFGQHSGTVDISEPFNGATTAEYQNAFSDIYGSNIPPKYGDIITLRDSSNGAFDSRWIIFPNDDSAPSNATVSFTATKSDIVWYAYNFSATSISSITDAIDQALGLFDKTGTVPRDDDLNEEVMGNTDAEFQIKISNIYQENTETGALEIGTSVPQITVAEGTIEPMEGLTANVAQASNNSLTVPADESCNFIHIYVKYEINFTGTQGSRVASTITNAEIVFKKSDSEKYLEGGEFSSTQTKYTHFMYIGAVAVTRRGNRRFAFINQVRSGNIDGIQNFNTKQQGTETDSSGTNVANKTKSGLREITLCVNGEPYSTFIITSALFEI